MRTLVESRHVLVVEARGRAMLVTALILIALHGFLLYSQMANLFRLSMSGAAYTNLIVTLLIYGILIHLASGPLSDKKTVTFHGIKSRVIVERSFPFGQNLREEIPFERFDRFEIPDSGTKGFCRLRLRDGEKVDLIRLTSSDDIAPLEHLQEITHKRVERVS